MSIIKNFILESILLFETEEFYKSYGIDGKLNPLEARLFYDFFYNKLKSKQILFYYDPEGLTKEAAIESGYPMSRGTLQYTTSFHSRNKMTLVYVMPEQQKILILPKNLLDPRLLIQLKSVAEIFPEFLDFQVKNIYESDEDEGFGILRNVLSNKKQVVGSFPNYVSRYEKEREEEGKPTRPEFSEFKFEVLQDITEIPWYHATRRSNLNSIKRTGLIPSKEFQQVQARGWTQLNFDLQNAVYLTLDLEHAKDIARTLKIRNEEPGVVLKIDGSVLKNTQNIAIDEDALRNDYDGNVTELPTHGMPSYISSVIHSIESIGYTKTISPKYISFLWSTNLEKED